MRDQCLTKAAAVTPSDTANLSESGIALYCGVSGDVKVVTREGDTITMGNLAAGIWHPIEVVKVFATGTAATEILVGW